MPSTRQRLLPPRRVGARGVDTALGVHTVHCTHACRPDTSANVIFADAANRLVKQGLVGTQGEAAAELPLGGIVHVVYVDYSNVQGHDSARRLALGSITGHGSLQYGAGLFDDQLYSVHASMH